MSPIPPAIETIIELFTSELSSVRFADLDGATLAQLATDAQAAADAVTVAQAALDGARHALQERQDALLTEAQRALAYAKVYAESDEALSARLEAIALPRARRRNEAADALVLSTEPTPATRKRGRPRKLEDDATPILEVSAPSTPTTTSVPNAPSPASAPNALDTMAAE
jgi:hypothetical protein